MFSATSIDVAIQNGTKIMPNEQKTKNPLFYIGAKKKTTNEMITINELIGVRRRKSGLFNEKCKSRRQCENRQRGKKNRYFQLNEKLRARFDL